VTLAALILAEGLALILAVVLARTWRHALVLLLAFALVNDLAIEGLHIALQGAPKPFAGWLRLAYHVETALVLGWPAMLAATCWRAFAAPHPLRRPVVRPRSAKRVLTAWGLTLAAFVTLYPLPKGWTKPLLTTWHLSMLTAATVAIRRGWGRQWTKPATLIGALVAVEIPLAILGPWGADVFADWERLARLPYVLAFGSIAGVELWWVVSPRLSRVSQKEPRKL
jgi:hypothetical protein